MKSDEFENFAKGEDKVTCLIEILKNRLISIEKFIELMKKNSNKLAI